MYVASEFTKPIFKHFSGKSKRSKLHWYYNINNIDTYIHLQFFNLRILDLIQTS